MTKTDWFKENLFKVSGQNFEEFALSLFRYQASENQVYRSYIDHLGINQRNVKSLKEVPFLPIEFFKTMEIKTGAWKEEAVFRSSGTTRTGRSAHFIRDLLYYHRLAVEIFKKQFGSPHYYRILALLPSYVEQGDSSLVNMVNHLISKAHPKSKFISKNDLSKLLKMNRLSPTIVFGVSYALLDSIENLTMKRSDYSDNRLTIIETGGMKGRKKEITRGELHSRLCDGYGTSTIHTQYGMTELQSHAYGMNGILNFPSWCRPMIRNINDPFDLQDSGVGALNIVDLANVHSCAFIETKDLASIKVDGSFEVSGRIDNSDIRGCSLLI